MATRRNPNLRVRISADLEDIKKGLGLLRGELARVKKDAERSMPSMKPFNDGIRQARNLLGGMFAGISAGMVVRQMVGETGQAQAEIAQLRAVLKSTGEVAGITETQLVSMAQNAAAASTFSTGEIIEAETRLLSYSAIAGEQFPRALQLAIDQSVRLGESLTQSAERIGTALEYPAQGVTSLTRQGFRFTAAQRALLKELEETNRLAEAQAIVMEVMEESYEGAARAARATLPGALKALGNAFKELLDGSGTGGASALVASVNNLADTLNSPAIRQGFAELTSQVLETVAAFARWMAQSGIEYIRVLSQAVILLVANIDLLVVALAGRLAGAAVAASIRLGSLTAIVTALNARVALLIGTLRTKMALLGGPWGIALAAAATAVYWLYRRSGEAKRAQEELNKALDENRKLADLSADAARRDALEKQKQARAAIAAARAVLVEAGVRRGMETEPTSRSQRAAQEAGRMADAPRVRRARAELEAAKAELDQWNLRLMDLSLELEDGLQDTVEDATANAIAGSNALLRDAIRRQLAELDRMYADHDIGVSAYFAGRLELQQKAIDAEIAQARMQLAVTKDVEGRRRLEEQIAILQRDRADAAVQGARDEKAAQEDLAKTMGDIHLERMENEGRLAAAARARLLDEHRATIASLQLEGRDEEVRTIYLHIDAEVAKVQLSEFENQMTQTLARLQATEESISSQQQAGLLGVIESERQIKDARTEAVIQLQELRQEAVAFMATLGADSPEAQKVAQFIQRLDGDLGTVASSMQRFRQQISDAAINSLSNFFMDLVDGSKSAKEALIDFVRSFVQGMAQIAARALATYLVLQMLDAIYPSLGKATAAMMGAGQYHGGGVVGSGSRVRRLISADAIARAPRYHNGGVAGGLKQNEELAVLEHGERVRTVEQERALQAQLAAGGSGGEVTTPVVVLGEDALANAMSGLAGRKMVVTHVIENWDTISTSAGGR